MKCDDKVCIHEVLILSSFPFRKTLITEDQRRMFLELLLLCSKTYLSERFFNENMTLLSLTMCFTA